jgi:hypothetical protein
MIGKKEGAELVRWNAADMKFSDLVQERVILIIGIRVTMNRNFFQDLHTVDLEEFRHGGTNITAFRLVDPEKPEIQKVIQDWIYGEKRYNRELDMGQNSNKVRCICPIDVNNRKVNDRCRITIL